MIFIEHVDFWSKIYLILYPSSENSTTHVNKYRIDGDKWPLAHFCWFTNCIKPQKRILVTPMTEQGVKFFSEKAVTEF